MQSAWTEYPNFLPRTAAAPKDFEGSPTHRNKTSSFWSLAVRHEDQPVLPIQVLDAHPEEFSLVPHPSVAHQDDNIAKKVMRFAVATCRPSLP